MRLCEKNLGIKRSKDGKWISTYIRWNGNYWFNFFFKVSFSAKYCPIFFTYPLVHDFNVEFLFTMSMPVWIGLSGNKISFWYLKLKLMLRLMLSKKSLKKKKLLILVVDLLLFRFCEIVYETRTFFYFALNHLSSNNNQMKR